MLAKLYGWPHEMLHLLALRLVGRRAQGVTHEHVDIPADLGRGQFVFVAGLPALVFWPLGAFGLQQLLAAQDLVSALFWMLYGALLFPAAVGTLGDLALIVMRLRSGE
ncbi:MAG: hypothetical protein OXF32_02020 [Anaerolineaceae bacterium]|nr:hypothetical protein [Anaerolineaceae bacterium]